MKRKTHKTLPGEFELRIRPDGRLSVLAADEALLDVVDALNQDNPAAILRRKAKNRAKPRKPGAGGESGGA